MNYRRLFSLMALVLTSALMVQGCAAPRAVAGATKGVVKGAAKVTKGTAKAVGKTGKAVTKPLR